MLAVLMLCANSTAEGVRVLRQQQKPSDKLLMTVLSPGKWHFDLHGKVRSLEILTIKLEPPEGQMKESSAISTTHYFDERGLETEMIDSQGGRTLNKYDAGGRITEMSMSLRGEPHMRYLYTYDLSQRKVTTEMYYFGQDGSHTRYVAFYDEHWYESRTVSESVKNNADEPPSKEVVIYTNSYDSKGRLTGLTVRREGVRINYRIMDEYGASGQIVKSTSYVYDESSGALTSKTVRSYDRRGLMSTVLHYDGQESLTRSDTYAREFDARGNWITEKRVSRDKNETVSFAFVTQRKITYY
jgi:hypothetical protein